ncbi:hypothetical protein [Mycobacteroides chelonae]|uniref:hypothetical protein n=1 Tax=Mycobacteroides chelonae TaxID=1774 RepID=UPI0004AAEEB7|nr:hypothetical protein [Mycobacteroides chelonae]OHT67790.1 hypothetical protein BKG66_24505 [Mycobacteroides chelonae]OHT69433.1 hypothetical protein BKG67_23040 [Mycobacteroides chelonae]
MSAPGGLAEPGWRNPAELEHLPQEAWDILDSEDTAHEVGGVRRTFYAGYHGPNLGQLLGIPLGTQLMYQMQKDMELEDTAKEMGKPVWATCLTNEQAQQLWEGKQAA